MIGREPWQNLAVCRDDDAAAWEPPLTADHVIKCGACPVRADCAVEGIVHDDRYMIRAAIDCTAGDASARLHAAAWGRRTSATIHAVSDRVRFHA